MKKTAAATLEIPISRVHLKLRSQNLQQYSKVDTRKKMQEVTEGDLKFLVNLTDYVDTGLFLDHRNLRQMVRQQAAGKGGVPIRFWQVGRHRPDGVGKPGLIERYRWLTEHVTDHFRRIIPSGVFKVEKDESAVTIGHCCLDRVVQAKVGGRKPPHIA